MAASASSIEAGKAIVRIFADDMGLKAGLKRASATLKSWAATTTAVGLSLVAAGSSILAPLLLAGKQAAAYGDGLNDAAAKTGIAVETLAELGYAAELSGTNLETFQGGIKKMQVTLNGARNGVKSSTAALAELGLTVGDLANMSPDEQFRLIADRISKIDDPARRTAAAMKVFGKAGVDLLPMLQDGAAGIAAMEAEADRLGISLAASMASGVGDVDDLLTTLTHQLHAFKTVVGAVVADAIRPIIKATQPIIANAIQWMSANQGLVKTLLLVGSGLLALGGILITAGVGGTVLLTALSSLVTIGVTLGGVIGGAFAFLLSPIGFVVAAVLAGVAAFTYFSGFGGAVLGYLGELWGNLKDTALSAWGGIVAAVGAGDLALAGEIAFAAIGVGWSSIVLAMKQAWSGFKTHFMQVISGAWYGMQAAFEIAVNGVANAWATVVATMSDVWAGFKSLVRDGWEGTMNWMEDRWLDIIAATTGQDRQALADQANKDRGQRDKGASDDQIGDQAKRDSAFKAQQDALKQQHDANMARIGQESIDASEKLKNADNSEIDKARAALEQKKKDLADAVAKANQQKATAGAGLLSGIPKMPEADLQPIRAAKAEYEARGSFSGFNLASLNVSSLSKTLEDFAERTAVATERIADNTEEDGSIPVT